MKKIIRILFGLLFICLVGCYSDPLDPDNIRMSVTFEKKGLTILVKVTVEGINERKIEQCGLHWETKRQFVSVSPVMSDEAVHIQTEGGKLVYEFEVFPWSQLIVEEYSPLLSCVLIAEPYITVKQTDYFGKPESQAIKTPIHTERVGSATLSGRDLIVKYLFSFPEEKEDIEECGIYWHREGETLSDEQKIVCGKEEGEYEIILKEGTLISNSNTRAYVKTRLGTWYAAPVPLTSTAGNMYVYITYIYRTSGGATIGASNEAANEDIFPVLERGFCYIESTGVPRTVFPTIDDYKVTVQPGTGQFTGTLEGLDPSLNYRACAYVINEIGVVYSTYREF